MMGGYFYVVEVFGCNGWEGLGRWCLFNVLDSLFILMSEF